MVSIVGPQEPKDLTFEKLNFILNTHCPPEPPIDAPNEVFLAYQRCKDSDDMARCYMMARMSTVLQAQHEDYITVRQIMDNLEDMFGGQAAESGSPKVDARTLKVRGMLAKASSSKLYPGNGKKKQGTKKESSSVPPNKGKNKKKKKSLNKLKCFHCGKVGT
ncbi:hypothetical protein L484_001814 [Morus notabilis]|uniref:Uncharacterized protein n=1 Tax=Morus notabilis TaxID=981085 RepID=W9R4Z8_9ROSA|nr:hypothetical protein L484_001814 [Morus notabilis]